MVGRSGVAGVAGGGVKGGANSLRSRKILTVSTCLNVILYVSNDTFSNKKR